MRPPGTAAAKLERQRRQQECERARAGRETSPNQPEWRDEYEVQEDRDDERQQVDGEQRKVAVPRIESVNGQIRNRANKRGSEQQEEDADVLTIDCPADHA